MFSARPFNLCDLSTMRWAHSLQHHELPALTKYLFCQETWNDTSETVSPDNHYLFGYFFLQQCKTNYHNYFKYLNVKYFEVRSALFYLKCLGSKTVTLQLCTWIIVNNMSKASKYTLKIIDIIYNIYYT